MTYLLLLPGGLLLLTLISIAWAYDRRTKQKDHAYILDYVDKPELGPYYMSVGDKFRDYPNRDSDGGIIDIYTTTGKSYFHPIQNTHYTFAVYAMYLETHDDQWKREFMRMVDAIANHGTKRDDGARVWYYPQKFWQDQTVPWISAMAQGQVIGIMCRAFELTGDERYLIIAQEAFIVFLKSIKEGGVCSDDCSLGTFYEEYAHKELKYQYHTLNGMTSALFNIFDLWKVSGNSQVRRVFDEGVATLRANLRRYDFPFCSSYDLRHVTSPNRPHVSARYHAVHVAHLHVLASLSKDAYFDGVADCWDPKLRDQTNRLRLAVAYITWKTGRILRKIFRF